MKQHMFNYLIIFMVIFAMGVLDVRAEDYNLSIKVYKTDDPENFARLYEEGKVEQEVSSSYEFRPGDILAVGVYEEAHKATAEGIFAMLNYDDEIVEPWRSKDKDTLSIVNFPNGWLGTSYYYENQARASIEGRNYDKQKIGESKVLGWFYFKVKYTAPSDTLFNFTFNRAVASCNKGYDEIEVSTVPATYRTYTSLTKPGFKGDLNFNGKIDFGDYMLLIGYVSKIVDFDEEKLYIADMNGDGKVNVTDQVSLINMFFRIVGE